MDYEKEASGNYYISENRFIEAPKRVWFVLQIPHAIRFALIWVIFFSIVGIIFQSIKAGRFVFLEFFVKNYVAWFKFFQAFSDVTYYVSARDLMVSIAKQWYYFFYTGGLFALIWSIVSWIINLAFVVKRPKAFIQPTIRQSVPQFEEQRYEQEKLKSEKAKQEQFEYDETKQKLETWLEEGFLLLSQKNLPEAELIYEHLRKEYTSQVDPYKNLFMRIKSFYDEILREKFPSRQKPKEDWEG